MARQRRGGFRPPELRGTLGTLLRTTLEQAGVVRDAISRGARSRFDEARSHRRRQDALASLGELVLDLIRRGEIDLAELPEAQDLVQLLDDLDASAPSDPDDRIAQPPTRGRFDARPPARSRHDDGDDRDDGYDRGRRRPASADEGYDRGRSRPPADEGYDRGRRSAADDGHDRGRRSAADDGHDRGRRSLDDGYDHGRRSPDDGYDHGRRSPERDDGTVSAIRGGDRSGPGSRSGAHSGTHWAPPKPASPPRVWRPSLPDDEPPPDARDPRDAPDPRDSRDARSARDARRPIPGPHRKGGIQFDNDEDLADYMHPDDVPPKPPTDDDR
jgi:hypothetical protein